MNADRENRTVNDFDSPEELSQALKSMTLTRSKNIDGQYISFKSPEVDEGQSENISAPSDPEAPGNQPQKLDPKLDWVLENYEESTTETQSLDDELQRLLVLKSYLLLDSERREAFERVTGLASRIFKCPMALISLVDVGRQWFMSNRGLGDTRETPRKMAFCAHAIMAKEDFLIVPDATKDFRFRENPLVTGPPDIRFYAGAPLISPEGYKLGTLCVLDRVARPGGITLEEKQNLMELAALAVQSCVDHKNNKMDETNNPARMIAYTAHDLLTPLTGVQLSLSLLCEDEDFTARLTPQQREMITTASNCTDMMGRICQTSIESFRKNKVQDQKTPRVPKKNANAPIAIAKLVKTLYMVLNPLPKKVPLVITVHPQAPDTIVTDELKVFRAAVNFLTNACAKTETGAVQLSISPISQDGRSLLLFECEDTGPGVPVEQYPHLFKPVEEQSEDQATNSCMKPRADGGFEAVSTMSTPDPGLGLYSVAVHITSLGGEYGFRPRVSEKGAAPSEKPVTGSIFWFKIPLVVPGSSETGASGGIYPTSVSDAFTERSLDLQFGGSGVKVLSTPTLSHDIASRVHESFTQVLEGDLVPQKMDATIDTGSTHGTSSSTSTSTEENGARKQRTDPKKMKEAVPLDDDETRKRKALVIEDSMVVRKSLTRVLTKLGFETTQAVDGMEGLKELQCSLFDVVLCDFLMPVMDGLDCVQQYREWEANHRPFFRQYIVGISAHAGEEDIAKGVEAGMDDFRPKPVTYKQLVDLQNSEELKVVGGILDEIAAKGTLMVDMVEDLADDGSFEDDAQDSPSPTEPSDDKTTKKRRSGSSIHFCLVGIENGKTDIGTLQSTASKRGWKIVVVHTGEEVLRLMKMRNWDLVLMDEDLPILQCSQCVARFREWEEKNRVNRQRNIVLLSASGLSTVVGSTSMVQLPFGFDISLGKPIRLKEFEYLMAQAERSESDFGVRDFVSR